jgi:hypothetical protein
MHGRTISAKKVVLVQIFVEQSYMYYKSILLQTINETLCGNAAEEYSLQ